LISLDFSVALATTAKRTRRSKAMVFVHGFNNRFDDAAYRLAQIVQDFKAPSFPFCFPGHRAASHRSAGTNMIARAQTSHVRHWKKCSTPWHWATICAKLI
jgi:hypothetical protein